MVRLPRSTLPPCLSMALYQIKTLAPETPTVSRLHTRIFEELSQAAIPSSSFFFFFFDCPSHCPIAHEQLRPSREVAGPSFIPASIHGGQNNTLFKKQIGENKKESERWKNSSLSLQQVAIKAHAHRIPRTLTPKRKKLRFACQLPVWDTRTPQQLICPLFFSPPCVQQKEDRGDTKSRMAYQAN